MALAYEACDRMRTPPYTPKVPRCAINHTS